MKYVKFTPDNNVILSGIFDADKNVCITNDIEYQISKIKLLSPFGNYSGQHDALVAKEKGEIIFTPFVVKYKGMISLCSSIYLNSVCEDNLCARAVGPVAVDEYKEVININAYINGNHLYSACLNFDCASDDNDNILFIPLDCPQYTVQIGDIIEISQDDIGILRNIVNRRV